MAVYNVKAPDGKMIKIEGPEGASQEEVIAQAQKLYTPQTVDIEDEGVSTFRELQYGFATGRTDVGNLGDLLESYMPSGRFFNPTETYGEEFMAMEPEQRREFLVDRRNKMIEEEYADVIAANETDTLSAKIGNFVGSIASPTSLAPIGHGYKAIAGMSAILGAEYDVLDQYVKTGEVNLKQTAAVAGASAVLAPVTVFGGRKLKDVYGNLKNKRNTAKTADVKASGERADLINEAATEAVAKGVPEGEIPAFIQNKTGFNGEEILEAYSVSGKSPLIPTVNEAKLAQELGNNGLDSTNRINKGLLHDMWQPIADRIEKISPEIALRLRNVDRRSHEISMLRAQRIEPFMAAMKAMDKNDKRLVKRYLLNSQYDEAGKVLNKVEGGADSLVEVRKVLDEMYVDLKDVGFDRLQKLDNYFPRNVKDVEGLMNSLGTYKLGIFERAIVNRAKQLKITPEKLSQVEKDKVLNNIVMGNLSPYDIPIGLGAAQKRTIGNVSDDILDFYDDPVKGIDDYIRYGTNNIEKRRFFGKKDKSVAVDEGEVLDLEQSVGNLISKELRGSINPADEDTLKEILKVRFTTGEMGGAKLIQGIRNATYLAKLANPISAVTQSQDLGTAVWVNGFGNTLKSLLGKDARRLTMQDLGLDQTIAEEFVNERVMAKTLHKFFTASGFRHMDRFGKNVLLGSSLRKAEKLVKSPKGLSELKEKVGKAFGEEYPALVSDLQNGKITDNVKLYLWNELANTQPISLSEMPLQYLKMPNGKIVYALKTFMLKQISNTLKRTKGEWDKGNRKKALSNTISFGLTVPTAGMGADAIKDMMLGRGFDDQDKGYGERLANNVLKVFGSSEYMVSKMLEGDLNKAVGLGNFLYPAMSTADVVWETIVNAAEGEMTPEIYKELPIAGKLYYQWFAGGIEKEQEKRIQRILKGIE